jgi:hypothetical protein
MSPITAANHSSTSMPAAIAARSDTPQSAPPPNFAADNITRTGAEIAGGWLGASAGGGIGEQTGALVGAVIGTACAPGAGTIAGEALGGMVGGLAGAIGGGITGATLGKAIVNNALGTA